MLTTEQVSDPTVTTETTTPTTQATAVTAPVVDRDEALRKAVEAARQEEKQKLYPEIERLKTELKSKMSPDEQTRQDLAEMRRQMEERDAQLRALQEQAISKQMQLEAELRRRDLQQYMQQKLAQAGTELFVEMVGGSSEAEIDASIDRAKAEFAKQKEFFFSQFAATQPTVQTPAAPTVQAVPTAVSVQAVPPSAFPTAANAAPVVQAQGPAALTEAVSALTSPDAMRNGTWAQNRQAVMAALRQQPSPYQGNGQPFANMPRQFALDAIQQPQGLPTPPVQNPRIQAAPPQPLANPVTHMQPQQPYQMPQQQMQQVQTAAPTPQQVEAGGAFDVAAARAAAVASAQKGLRAPQALPAAVQGAVRLPGEYAAKANVDVDFSTGHPMIRQSQ